MLIARVLQKYSATFPVGKGYESMGANIRGVIGQAQMLNAMLHFGSRTCSLCLDATKLTIKVIQSDEAHFLK